MVKLGGLCLAEKAFRVIYDDDDDGNRLTPYNMLLQGNW